VYLVGFMIRMCSLCSVWGLKHGIKRVKVVKFDFSVFMWDMGKEYVIKC